VRGFIQAAKPSTSGKTLSVQVGGKWMSTKLWELQSKVGQEIVGETSESDFNGKTMTWLNSYSMVDGSAAPVAQSAPQAPAPSAPAAAGPSPYQPLVSNLAAHLIQAGGSPEQLPAWFNACRSLLENELNDSIPF
jgi:hypothetical protein